MAFLYWQCSQTFIFKISFSCTRNNTWLCGMDFDSLRRIVTFYTHLVDLKANNPIKRISHSKLIIPHLLRQKWAKIEATPKIYPFICFIASFLNEILGLRLTSVLTVPKSKNTLFHANSRAMKMLYFVLFLKFSHEYQILIE